MTKKIFENKKYTYDQFVEIVNTNKCGDGIVRDLIFKNCIIRDVSGGIFTINENGENDSIVGISSKNCEIIGCEFIGIGEHILQYRI